MTASLDDELDVEIRRAVNEIVELAPMAPTLATWIATAFPPPEQGRRRRLAIVAVAVLFPVLVAVGFIVASASRHPSEVIEPLSPPSTTQGTVARPDDAFIGTTPAAASEGCPGTLVVRPTGSGPAAQIRQWSTYPGTDLSGWHGEAGTLEVSDNRTIFISDTGFRVQVFALAVDC